MYCVCVCMCITLFSTIFCKQKRYNVNESSDQLTNFVSYKTDVIEKNCWSGLEEYFISLIKALSVECEEGSGSGGLKRKTRKRRRATGVVSALQTHASEHMATNHQISPSNSPHAHGKYGRNMSLRRIIYAKITSRYL